MQANAPLPQDTAFWSLVSGSATIVDAPDPLTSVTDIAIGVNVLAWTIITPLDTTTDPVSIVRYEYDPAFADAGPNQLIYAPPFSATLNASPPIFPQVCSWSVIQGPAAISNPNDPQATASSLGLGENIFQWTCPGPPCTALNADQVVITVEMATSVGTIANGGPPALWFDNGLGVLHMAGDVQPGSLTVVNGTGQFVPVRADRAGATADLSDLPPGCYAAMAIISEERKTLRFVVNR